MLFYNGEEDTQSERYALQRIAYANSYVELTEALPFSEKSPAEYPRLSNCVLHETYSVYRLNVKQVCFGGRPESPRCNL